MSGAEAAEAVAAAVNETANETEYGMPVTLFIYGLLADCLMAVPILLYILLDNTLGYGKYHQAMINMIASSYAPLSLLWVVLLLFDSEMARSAFIGAVEMAGLGPMALLWVGYLSFLMSASQAGVLDEKENTTFVFIYGLGNIGLLILHALFAPGLIDYAKNAPLPVDEPTPPSEPSEEEEAEE